MATIKDMAENSGYPTLAEKAAYWNGANAVLQEIEAIIEEYSEYYPGNNESFISYNVLIGKIKELKGERL